jgi:hypothetical protein
MTEMPCRSFRFFVRMELFLVRWTFILIRSNL